MNHIIINNPETLKQTIIDLNRLHIPIYILGKIGIGKSDIIKQIHEQIYDCKECYFEDIRASYLDNTDLRGLFKIDEKEGVTKWYLSEKIGKFTKPNVKGTILFDEINLASEDIQSSLYQIILDRNIEGKRISDDVMIIAAGNTSDEADMVRPLSPALYNRFAVIEYNPEPKYIIKYLAEKYNNQEQNKVILFLKNNIDSVIEDVNKDEEVSVFARPRGWERVMQYLSNGNVLNVDDKVQYNIISSIVGIKAAHKLLKYIQDVELFNIDKILREGITKEYINSLTSVNKYALMSAAVLYFKYNVSGANNDTIKRLAESLYNTIITHMPEDYKFIFYKECVSKNENIRKALSSIPEIKKMLLKITDLVNE